MTISKASFYQGVVALLGRLSECAALQARAVIWRYIHALERVAMIAWV